MRRNLSWGIGICWCFVAITITPAFATDLLENLLTITQEGVGSMSLSGSDLGCVQSNHTFDCPNQTFTPTDEQFTWELSNWFLSADLDPFVSQSFSFKNLGETATFRVSTEIPITPPLSPSSLMGGSTGGWVSDTSLDGAGGLSTVLGEAFYVGVIDGVSITSSELHSDPFNINFAFSGETVSIPSASFGLPGPTLSGPSAMTSIGIVNTFSLAGGDSVSSSNYFIVEAIPEPSMMGLLTTSSLVMLGLRRRRKS